VQNSCVFLSGNIVIKEQTNKFENILILFTLSSHSFFINFNFIIIKKMRTYFKT